MATIYRISMTQAEYNAYIAIPANTVPNNYQILITDAPAGAPNLYTGTGTNTPASGTSSGGTGGFNNFTATTAPTATDDSGDGYTVGSRWIDITNDESYICVDNTLNNAVWSKTTVGIISEVAGLQSTLDTKAPLASPAFTGTPTGITKTHVGLANVENTSDADKIISTAQQTALNLKQDASTAATDAELTAHTGNVANPHGVNATQLNLGNVENTSDADKIVSIAQQAALNGKSATTHNHTGTYEPADATILKESEVVNTLVGTATNLPLSAAQGKALKDTADTLSTTVGGKQATLVSGTTVKTVNGASVLGSGDIVITPTTVSSTTPTHNLDLVGDNYAGRALHLRPNGMIATTNLATWSDISGNSRDVTQATAANQPDVVENVLNGLPVVRFDGTDDFMSRATFDMGTSYSIFAVFRTGATVGGQITSEHYLGGASNIRYVLGAAADGTVGALRFGVFNGSWINATDSVVMAANTTYIASGVRESGGNMTLWKNGVQVGQVASGTNPSHDAARQFYVSRRWDGVWPSSWIGDIAEIVIFPAALSATERQKVEGVLSHKYGLLASLDAGHPYKTNPPQAGSLQIFTDNASAITGGLTVGQVYMSSDGLLRVVF